MRSFKKTHKAVATGTTALALAVVAVAGLAPGSAFAATGYGYNVPTGPSTVNRFYNSHTGDHLYTTSSAEGSYATQLGYQSEVSSYKAFDKTAAGTESVYRAFNSSRSDHLYTTSFSEYATAVKLGYQQEGVAFKAYVNAGDAAGNGVTGQEVAPVYRLNSSNVGNHMYTGDLNEYTTLSSARGYHAEGVAFYTPTN